MSDPSFHTPGASRVYELIWDEAEDDPIVAESFTVTHGDGALVLSSIVSSGTSRRFRATGGTDGVVYVVKHAVTFTSGDIDSRSMTLRCVAR